MKPEDNIFDNRAGCRKSAARDRTWNRRISRERASRSAAVFARTKHSSR